MEIENGYVTYVKTKNEKDVPDQPLFEPMEEEIYPDYANCKMMCDEIDMDQEEAAKREERGRKRRKRQKERQKKGRQKER